MSFGRGDVGTAVVPDISADEWTWWSEHSRRFSSSNGPSTRSGGDRHNFWSFVIVHKLRYVNAIVEKVGAKADGGGVETRK